MQAPKIDDNGKIKNRKNLLSIKSLNKNSNKALNVLLDCMIKNLKAL